MESREQIIRETHAFHCLECGKCTAACPVSRVNNTFSPRALLSKLLTGDLDAILADDKLYTCLTCGLCRARCPSDVRFTELMMLTRIEAFEAGHKGTLSHGGVLHEVMRLHTAAGLEQQRGDWLGEGLETSENGDILYFAGCQPYFDSALVEIGVQATEIGRSAVGIFNALGIAPTVIPNERCCGHDLLWTGDEKNFNILVERNLEAIRKTGAKKLVTSCAECYRTFALDYPKRAGKLDFEVLHISQFLAENLEALKGTLSEDGKRITYHDPCRLGRHMGVYDPPRQVLAALPGAEIREMAHNRHNAVCCGTSAWLNCDQFSKRIQIGRLKEAEATGAETVVTTCPKCYIHFTCAKSEKGCGEGAVKIEVQDLCVLLAKSLKGGKAAKAKASKG